MIGGLTNVHGTPTGTVWSAPDAAPRKNWNRSPGLWVYTRDRRRGLGDFEDVALLHLDSLYNAALRLTRNRADAEDVVQEAVLRAFRAFDTFDRATNCRAWLFTILRNVFLNRERRRGREVLDEGLTFMEPAGGPAPEWPAHRDPEDEFLQTVLHGDVERALRALPFAYREVVILADLEGLTYKEVAQALGCPVGTVMSRLSRGREMLRQALASFAREHGYAKGTG
jgi:RNA polymerase sigma-70 factor (ECF subfamily)